MILLTAARSISGTGFAPQQGTWRSSNIMKGDAPITTPAPIVFLRKTLCVGVWKCAGFMAILLSRSYLGPNAGGIV